MKPLCQLQLGNLVYCLDARRETNLVRYMGSP